MLSSHNSTPDSTPAYCSLPHLHAVPHSMHVKPYTSYSTIFIILFALLLNSSVMNGHFKCRILCGQTFDSSHALLQHRPSCILYQQESTKGNITTEALAEWNKARFYEFKEDAATRWCWWSCDIRLSLSLLKVSSHSRTWGSQAPVKM